MTPEYARTLYWKTMEKVHRTWPENKPEIGLQMELQCWEAVIGGIRKSYEVELERLREENRSLKQVIMDTVTADAG